MFACACVMCVYVPYMHNKECDNVLYYVLKLCCAPLLQVYSKVEEIKRLQRDAYNF